MSVEEQQRRSRRSPRGHWAVTFAVLAIAVSAFTLLQSMVVPVLGLIAVEMDTDMSTATWVLTAYLLSASICTPLLGRVGDVVGKQKMLVVTMAALAIGSLVAALATDIWVLILARVLQGAGGGVLPLSFGIIRDEFPERSRTTALSVIAALGSVGFAVGIVVAGPIVDGLGYAWLFWLPMGVTALAAVATAFFVPSSPVAERTRLPLLPAVLLAGWLVALLLGISRGNEWGWASLPVLGLLVAAGLLAVGWVVVENRARVPMIDMRMMRQRGVWTSNVVGGFVGFGMFSSFGFLPQFLQTPSSAGYGFGATIAESGHILLPSAIASFVIGFATAPLVKRLGARVVVVAGTLMTAVAFGSIAVWHDQVWQIVAATTLQGLGNGLVFGSLAGVVIASVPASQTGVASGMNANIRSIGGSVGSAVMAGVVTAHVGVGGLPAEGGYVIGFALIAVAMVLAALVACAIPGAGGPTGRAPRRVASPRRTVAPTMRRVLAPGSSVGV
ncbi:MFS transporter [Nocardioides zeae]|uniref:MFS transporter n=1 Tax=Nocardioides imazamoxiresistens TaxID=3231893 RepID=A0ABU3PYL8_9ACTN|nr:MFS transporter [Nocardioides zeae]MDT9594343.1 MFS transporter [Nocardioides zeae]